MTLNLRDDVQLTRQQIRSLLPATIERLPAQRSTIITL